MIIYLVLIFAFLYFFMIRPQKKEQKKMAAMLSALEIGDCVLTNSGFYGIVIDITDDGQLIDLFYGFINKQSSKYVNPGNFARGMFDEIHTFEGGENGE